MTFADGEHMWEYLKIHPGAVSPLGLLFDTQKKVHFLIDKDVLNMEKIAMHPCVNTATVALSTKDFIEKICRKIILDNIELKLDLEEAKVKIDENLLEVVMRNLIQNLSHQGIAILISSHNLTEINNLCNRIITIKNGKIITNDTIEEFKTFAENEKLSLEEAFIKKVGENKID